MNVIKYVYTFQFLVAICAIVIFLLLAARHCSGVSQRTVPLVHIFLVIICFGYIPNLSRCWEKLEHAGLDFVCWLDSLLYTVVFCTIKEQNSFRLTFEKEVFLFSLLLLINFNNEVTGSPNIDEVDGTKGSVIGLGIWWITAWVNWI